MVPSSYGLKNGGECRFRAQAGGVLLLGVVAGGGGCRGGGTNAEKVECRGGGVESGEKLASSFSLSLSLSLFFLSPNRCLLIKWISRLKGKRR